MSRWRFAWAWFVAATLSLPALAQWAPATAGWQVAGVVSPVGSGVSGLTSGRVTLSTGATTVGDDAGCTWTGTGASFVATILGGVKVGDGSVAAPSLGFASVGSGFSLNGATIRVSHTNTYRYSFGFGSFNIGSALKLGWESGAAESALDLALSRASAGVLLVEDGAGNPRDVQARAAVLSGYLSFGGGPYFEANSAGGLRLSGLPTGQNFGLHPVLGNLVDLAEPSIPWRTGYFGTSLYSPLIIAGPDATGTNASGGNLYLQPKAGTGSAAGAFIYFNTPDVGASGTTVQTQSERLRLSANNAVFSATAWPAIAGTYDLGVSSIPWRTGYFGTSVYSPLVSAGPDATGTNTAGANLTIQPQAGTGSATGSSIIFQTPTATTSGTTAQTQTTRMTVDETGVTATGPVITNSYVYAAGGVIAATGTTVGFQGGVVWMSGAGTPEGAVPASVGSIYSRTDGGAGTSFYVKESGTGNTGWVAK